MESRPAQGLGQVQIPLPAGDAVEQQHRGVQPLPGGGEEHGQEPSLLSGDQDAVEIRTAGGGPVMWLRTENRFIHGPGLT